jgi:lysophospholipase
MITPLSIYNKRVIYEMFELCPLLDSSSMTKDNWVTIANTIARFYAQYDAFILLHGTDTMAYTAAILSFILEGLNKPVIVTGS